MNTKKVYLIIVIVFSIVPVIVGMLMLIFSGSANEKTGLAMAAIGPAVIWGVYGCAFFVFKGGFFWS